MSQPLPSGRPFLLLQVLRQTIREVGFDKGNIIAVLHEGRFTTITLTSKTTHGAGQASAPQMSRGTSLSGKQMGDILLERLNLALAGWKFRFGNFKFKVADSEVINTKVTLRVRPNEEDQLSLL